jgi:Zn-dependent protease
VGSDRLQTFVILLPIFIGSLTLHELAHGWVAFKLGDPTAKLMGRLSFNPIVHLDALGSMMFVMSYWAGGFLFGWAKPVPVNPHNLRIGPQRGMAVVGAAGPATNFVLALGFGFALAHGQYGSLTTLVLWDALLINVVLGVFNLLPIPPLDGSRIVGGLMGDTTYVRWAQLDQYGMIVLLGMFLVLNGPFTTLLRGATLHTLSIISTIVGGTPISP